MGHFFVDCEVTHIRNPKKTLKVSHILVDTGSEYTWIAGGDGGDSMPPSATVDGLLGLDFLQKRRLMIDFRKGLIGLD